MMKKDELEKALRAELIRESIVLADLVKLRERWFLNGTVNIFELIRLDKIISFLRAKNKHLSETDKDDLIYS